MKYGQFSHCDSCFYLQQITTDPQPSTFFTRGTHQLKVVGNVYENPDMVLLKEKGIS
jgi:hypothetical protein